MSEAADSRWVRVSREGPGIAVVQMRASVDKNALSEGMVKALLAAFDSVGQDREVKAVVLLGLPEVFCSGAPPEILRDLATHKVAPTELTLSRAVIDVPVPVIAAMEGHATGGGLALGCAADLVLAARESRYGANFMNMGFTPGMGMTRLLEHVLPAATAHELLYTGEFRRGADYERCGAFNYVLPRAEVTPRAFELAQAVAEKPRQALEMLKRALTLPRRKAWEETRTIESLMHEVCFREPDIRRRIEDEYAE
jgi:polyketide biosynthesis enoyl-CoA hydratase PksI